MEIEIAKTKDKEFTFRGDVWKEIKKEIE